jgi:hypothetical protein
MTIAPINAVVAKRTRLDNTQAVSPIPGEVLRDAALVGLHVRHAA